MIFMSLDLSMTSMQEMEKKGEDNYDHNEDYLKCISSGSTACAVTGADRINHDYLYNEFCGWSI